MTPARAATSICFLLLGVLALAAAWSYGQDIRHYLSPAGSLMFDDGFMFVRYAKIWLLGHGEAWNIGEPPAYGNTSQLHFLLVLLLTATLDWPVESLAALSSTLAALVALLWLPYFAARHGQPWQHYPLVVRYALWFAVLWPLLYWNSQWKFHSGTGMDAMLSLLMHIWLIDAVLSYGRSGRRLYFVAICVVAYLAYCARPDNLVVAGLFPFLYLALVMKNYRMAFCFAAILSTAVLVDAFFKYLYFGDYFPLAYYSKRLGFLENYGYMGEIYHSPFRTFFMFLLGVFPFLLPVIFFFRRQPWILLLVLVAPAALTLAYYFTMIAVMNYGGRYFYPFLPYFLALAVLWLPGELHWRQKRGWLVLQLCLAIGMYVLFSVGDKYNYEIAKSFLREDQGLCDDTNLRSVPVELPRFTGAQSNRHLADMLSGLPQGLKIAMSEHGYVGARNPQVNIIDLVGLHSRQLAHYGFTAQWLFEQKPDAIQMGHWQYSCLNASIVDAKEFWEYYEFYPHLYAWGFALRKDSPYYEALDAAVRESWNNLYPDLDINTYRRAGPLPQVDYAGNERRIRAYEEKRRPAQQERSAQ